MGRFTSAEIRTLAEICGYEIHVVAANNRQLAYLGQVIERTKREFRLLEQLLKAA